MCFSLWTVLFLMVVVENIYLLQNDRAILMHKLYGAIFTRGYAQEEEQSSKAHQVV